MPERSGKLPAEIYAFPQVVSGREGRYLYPMKERVEKIVITFRLDPKIKEAAKKIALAAKQTLSRYVEELIRIDLWRKRLLG
jgi:hypothetical protein